ncbi:MAG: Triosephosphate isomerase [Candidatus Woesebacteria bacterium GW2011_GWB1_38_5b]|uniref:Triosephosphate isomerase n=1 Tax=Candidatus Woesebacteria bacterium GW2011_GWB1_38_5b TaxID=1618569 RepID=A0A0G0MJX9_9BACT|nr:MAG: Triosephosphate isomerase [Candidatus Woesebacteria bacterium GW2011_GWB1_38_5b]
MLFVNFKTYEEGSGPRALALVHALEEVSTQTQIKIIPVVAVLDAETIATASKLEIWVQHVDPVEYGAHTGWTLPSELARIGIHGVFLNHSEHKFEDFEALTNAAKICQSQNLKTLIFAADIKELKLILKLKPDFVAYEPPELVGSTTKSVASEKPEIISTAAEIAKTARIPLIVGAGIHTSKDIKRSLELGAVGFAVATNIVKAKDPKSATMALLEGF